MKKSNQLKPLMTLKDPRPFQQIHALDIETSSLGELLDIGLYTSQGSSPQYFIFESWTDLWSNYIQDLEGEHRFIAHNGMGFDYIGLIQWIMKNHKQFNIDVDKVQFFSSESSIVAIGIKTDQYYLTLADTTRFFPGQKLNDLAKDFLGEEKDDVPEGYISRMEDYKREFKKDYYKYLKQDCYLLYSIYETFRDQVNEFTDIGELGLSAGSTSMSCFRRDLHHRDPKMFIFSCPKPLLGAAEETMRGGLTLYIGNGDAEKHQYDNVYHYDVVSMYPSLMGFVPVPISPMEEVQEIRYLYDRVHPGFYYVTYEQSEGPCPIFFNIGKPNPNFRGEAILNHIEIEILQKVGRITKVHGGVIMPDFAYPFKDYLDNILATRMIAKKEGKKAKAHALKILANSLYGKFAQAARREQIAITSNIDWYESLQAAEMENYGQSSIMEYYFDDSLVLYGIESDSTSFSNRFIGSMVTSFARLKLALLFNSYRVIYCDTDSIFTQDKIDPSFMGASPGQWEINSSYPDGATLLCLGKKSYQYGDDRHFKGIPRDKQKEIDFQKVRNGEKFRIDYRSPTAMKSALRAGDKIQNPNEFLPRFRTVQRGRSMKEAKQLKLSRPLLDPKEMKDFFESLLII